MLKKRKRQDQDQDRTDPKDCLVLTSRDGAAGLFHELVVDV